jgi:hypothetical protein
MVQVGYQDLVQPIWQALEALDGFVQGLAVSQFWFWSRTWWRYGWRNWRIRGRINGCHSLLKSIP